MTLFRYVFLSLFFIPVAAFAKIDAAISVAEFRTEELHYVEVHTNIIGSMLTPDSIAADQYQAAVEVLYIFKQGETIVKFDKLRLKSPVRHYVPDLIDLQRYVLDPGVYVLEIELTDLNEPSSVSKVKIDFEVHSPTQETMLSDLILLSNVYKDTTVAGNPLARNGVVMEPLPSHFYDRYAEQLFFYGEVYDAQAMGEEFLVTYYYEDLGVPKDEREQLLISHKKKPARAIVPLLLQSNIAELPSGNYALNLEIRNLSRELIESKRIAFQRSNPLFVPKDEPLSGLSLTESFVSAMDNDSLRYALKALMPVASPIDVAVLSTLSQARDSASVTAQRLHLLKHWSKKNPNNPEKPYREYMEVVNAIHKNFYSGFRLGFETDRGYIYLKYGRPDDVVRVSNEMSAPPYEMWVYYDFPQTKQSNVKFIFYNPSLVDNDFTILHSTANGERNNPNWEIELYRDAPNQVDQSDPSGTTMMDNFSRQASRLFNDL